MGARAQFSTVYGRFDTKSFRYKFKSFRDIIKVDSIHIASQFDSTQYLCSQPLISGHVAYIHKKNIFCLQLNRLTLVHYANLKEFRY